MSQSASASQQAAAAPDPLDFLDSPEMKAILAAKAASFPTRAADINSFLESMPIMTTRTPLADEERSADLAAVEALAGEERTEDRVEAFKQSGNEAYKLANALQADADKNEAQLTELKQRLAAQNKSASATGKAAVQTDEAQQLQKEIDRLEDKLTRQRAQYAKKLRDAYIYYSQAIDLRTFLPLLASSCYANRSLVALQLRNNRSALEDAREAVKLDRNNSKAWWRGATALKRIGQLSMAQEWVDSGLAARHISKGEREALLRLGREVKEEERREEEKKTEKLERRKKEQVEQEAKHQEEEKESNKVAAALRERGLTLGAPLFTTDERKEEKDDEDIASTASTASSSPYSGRIQLLPDGSLSYPLLFLYPQHQQSDYIQSHHELEPLSSALALLFPPAAPSPPWDSAGQYRADRLQVWLEWEGSGGGDGVSGRVPVDVGVSLLSVLSMPALRKRRYRIPGVPTFVVEPLK